MALQSNDLFVIQSQSDNELYKLKLSDLIAEVEASDGLVFKGSVDLNNAPAAQTPPVTLPGNNGDLYMVESNATTIDAGWVMIGGETSATQGDRIIYDSVGGGWVLISSGSASAGTVTGITASLPLKSDGDNVTPVISIRAARTLTAATGSGDNEGAAGSVARLAEEADVIADTGTGSNQAVVTADLLKTTNDLVATLSLNPGGVTSVTTDDTDGNSALTISPTSGNVKIEINTADDSGYGVVQLADASKITNGTAGAGAVVDAAQLAAAVTGLPDEAVSAITEGGTDTVANALDITTSGLTDGKKTVTIGVNNDVFCPYDFSTLSDITD